MNLLKILFVRNLLFFIDRQFWCAILVCKFCYLISLFPHICLWVYLVVCIWLTALFFFIFRLITETLLLPSVLELMVCIFFFVFFIAVSNYRPFGFLERIHNYVYILNFVGFSCACLSIDPFVRVLGCLGCLHIH